MKDLKDKDVKHLNGTVYLIGFAISIISMIGVFTFTENASFSISSSLPIGITVGIIMEQKIEREQNVLSPVVRKRMIGLLLLGVIAFLSVVFLVN